VQILVFDIADDFTPGQNHGVLGYFYAGDEYSSTKYPNSNECEMFYLDAYFTDAFPAWMYSTLAHEFQHMIHYNVKNLQQKKSSGVWFNEMLSMLAEDIICPQIGIPLDPLEDNGHPVGTRISTFLSTIGTVGVTDWNSASPLNNYAMAYAFGAYLVRNYGGAKLIADLMETSKVDIAAIDKALADRNSSFTDALEHFGEVLFCSTSKGNPDKSRSYDHTVTKTVNGKSYTFDAFDVWTVPNLSGSTGPVFRDPATTLAIPSYSISVHTSDDWQNKSGSLTIKLTKPASNDVHFYLIKQ
jgi:hypothetical protein